MKILKEINQDELNDIRNMQKKMVDYHIMPSPVTSIKLESAISGETHELYEDRSKSWVRNAYSMLLHQLMFCPMVISGAYNTCKYADDGVYLRKVDGNYWGSNGWAGWTNVYGESYFRARASQVDKGIVVGVGTTAEKLDSHSLSSICASGNGVNQLNAQEQPYPTITVDPSTRVMTVQHSRSFLNTSGNTIMVSEVALYNRTYSNSSGESSIMFNRDLLTTPIAVLNNGLLTVTYTLELQLPPADV